MSNKSEVTTSGGIGFFGILTIVFIALKLTNYIDWSWWLVLLPLYGPFIFIFVVLIFIAIFINSVKN